MEGKNVTCDMKVVKAGESCKNKIENLVFGYVWMNKK